MTSHKDYKIPTIEGRYITHNHIYPFVSTLPESFKIAVLGTSVNGNSIKSISFGKGPIRILMWSQMHGNESTTTKAVLDVLNYLALESDKAKRIANKFTLTIIPILNPDGALAYTRVNANNIDLNRDAQHLSQPESTILRAVFNTFKPSYCFNLHDQRTIFNVGSSSKPATVSFLAPAFDEERNISPSREKSMLLIAAMNAKLQELIPHQVGRYDDSFNANCVGDAFQMEDVPTILFEAGHFYDDYTREKTRSFIFYALLQALETLDKEALTTFLTDDYFTIPENSKQFVDIVVENPNLINPAFENQQFVYLHYKETLAGAKVIHTPEVLTDLFTTKQIFGHKRLNAALQKDIEFMKLHGIYNLIA